MTAVTNPWKVKMENCILDYAQMKAGIVTVIGKFE